MQDAPRGSFINYQILGIVSAKNKKFSGLKDIDCGGISKGTLAKNNLVIFAPFRWKPHFLARRSTLHRVRTPCFSWAELNSQFLWGSYV